MLSQSGIPRTRRRGLSKHAPAALNGMGTPARRHPRTPPASAGTPPLAQGSGNGVRQISRSPAWTKTTLPPRPSVPPTNYLPTAPPTHPHTPCSWTSTPALPRPSPHRRRAPRSPSASGSRCTSWRWSSSPRSSSSKPSSASWAPRTCSFPSPPWVSVSASDTQADGGCEGATARHVDLHLRVSVPRAPRPSFPLTRAQYATTASECTSRTSTPTGSSPSARCVSRRCRTTPANTPTVHIHAVHPRHRLLRIHQARASLVLPALRHVPALPHRVPRGNGVHGPHAEHHAARQPLRLPPHLRRVGPPSREPERVRHDDRVLCVRCREQHLDRHPAAAAADPDPAAAAPAVAREAGAGGHVLDGLRVRLLCALCACCADCCGSVTIVSGVSLWKMLAAIDGSGDMTCEFLLCPSCLDDRADTHQGTARTAGCARCSSSISASWPRACPAWSCLWRGCAGPRPRRDWRRLRTTRSAAEAAAEGCGRCRGGGIVRCGPGLVRRRRAGVWMRRRRRAMGVRCRRGGGVAWRAAGEDVIVPRRFWVRGCVLGGLWGRFSVWRTSLPQWRSGRRVCRFVRGAISRIFPALTLRLCCLMSW